MDTFNHFTTSFAETVIPLTALNVPQVITIPCGIVAGLLGASPDIIGEFYALDIDIDTKYFKWKKVGDNYVMYNKIHNGEHWLCYIPFVKQHIYFDKFCHGDGNRWYAGKFYEYFMPTRYREKMWMESLFWGINIILLIIWFIIK